MKKLVLASTNKNKLTEIQKSFEELHIYDVEIEVIHKSLLKEPEEPYDTFKANSLHKAKHYANLTGCITLSEDSGLVVEELGGFPGVYSKEFILENKGVSGAIISLERKLENSSEKKASFVSAVSVYDPNNLLFISNEAEEKGNLCFPPKGNYGYGFDPIFIPEGHSRTFAEMTMKEKNSVSHRLRVLEESLIQIIRW
ncbi:non-canonical purine NTP pyrophosphatase [Candidatus Neptunichlamydia sp. REUL1]|uniref:non-canonical purine NTP pyrophosphatase n=1 Tax=Candidatus Neptunichlamydia sp. REUL1 TaxID=3064277 RepID=UPI00292CAED0|nr:non-canonical purine NTP pyrophosphatase [Candidatus Neptunochlamydia sp. REUL1]